MWKIDRKEFYMSLKTLYNLFYSDKKNYLNEYEKRYNDDETIHFDFSIGKNSAFIYQSTTILKAIIEIERIDKKIQNIEDGLPPIALNQYARRCLIGEIVKTNDIEGVHSTRKEIGAILDNINSKNKKDRFVGLVNKYFVLMGNEDIPLASCTDIRRIYDDIFIEEIKKDDVPDGVIFRKNGVDVQGNNGEIIHHGISPESSIIEYLEKFLHFLNDDRFDILIRISAFHFLFCYVHPFYDGNGRMSRFISCYLLSKHLNSLIGYRLSYTIKERLSNYYKGFKICEHVNSKGDITPFGEMFLQIILESEKQLLEALAERNEKLIHYKSLIDKLPNSNNDEVVRVLYDYLIQATLFSDKGITRDELMHYLKVSKSTLPKKLEAIPKDLFIAKRKPQKIYYTLDLAEAEKYGEKGE